MFVPSNNDLKLMVQNRNYFCTNTMQSVLIRQYVFGRSSSYCVWSSHHYVIQYRYNYIITLNYFQVSSNMNQLLFWNSCRVTAYSLHSMLYNIWYEASTWLMFLEDIISSDGQSFNEFIWPSLWVMCWSHINLSDIISYAELSHLNESLAN